MLLLVDGKGEEYTRPVLVVKFFNKHQIWVVPLTSKAKNSKYNVKINSSYRFSFCSISQLKAISTKRLFKYMGKINHQDQIEIIESIVKILTKEKPALSGNFSRPFGNNELILSNNKSLSTIDIKDNIAGMTHEIETKVLDINSDQIKNKLLALGAKLTKHTRLIVDWYRLRGIKNGEDPWYLRIRSDSFGKSEITWKAKSSILGTVRKHKEINILIDNPKMHEDLLEEIGLEKYAHQEKDRTSFEYKNWVFDLDIYPEMPAFLEIEGQSENHIKEAMILLNIENNKTWVDGERTLIEKIYGLDWYNMKF